MGATYLAYQGDTSGRMTYDNVGNVTSLLHVTNGNQKQCFTYVARARATTRASARARTTRLANGD